MGDNFHSSKVDRLPLDNQGNLVQGEDKQLCPNHIRPFMVSSCSSSKGLSDFQTSSQGEMSTAESHSGSVKLNFEQLVDEDSFVSESFSNFSDDFGFGF
jgi:hypothetical protein